MDSGLTIAMERGSSTAIPLESTLMFAQVFRLQERLPYSATWTSTGKIIKGTMRACGSTNGTNMELVSTPSTLNAILDILLRRK